MGTHCVTGNGFTIRGVVSLLNYVIPPLISSKIGIHLTHPFIYLLRTSVLIFKFIIFNKIVMLFLNSIFVEFLKDPQPAADVRHVEGKLKLTMVERLVQ